MCVPDATTYKKGIRVSDNELRNITIGRHDFHGEWNYTMGRQEPACAGEGKSANKKPLFVQK
jgi:hypothetical protein